MKPIKYFVAALIAAAFFGGTCIFAAQVENPRVQWMKGRHGVMVHWLYPSYDQKNPEQIDKLTDAFDVGAFMKDFDASGAEWLIFTVGQNRGAYASPNSVIDKYCGPGHTSKRDLILEIAKAVHERGKKFIAYVPCEVRGNKSVRDGLKWNDDIKDPKLEFQKRYTDALREWSLRYGKLCDGWWVDGAYADIAPHLDWKLWHDAMRAGNSDAVVTFNPGIVRTDRILLLHPDHDYLAGEVNVLLGGKIRRTFDNDNPDAYLPPAAYYSGTKTLWHVLLPMDSFWGAYSPWKDWVNAPWKNEAPCDKKRIHPPVYSDKDLGSFLAHMKKIGAAVTINMGITAEGRLSADSISQLNRIDSKK